MSSGRKTNHVVILIHGIRTQALWQHHIRLVLEQAGMAVVTTRYEYLDLVRVVLPLELTRRGPVDRIEGLIRDTFGAHPEASVSVIAHSFGSYIVSRILVEQPDIRRRLDRIILCGAVVPDDFHWEHFDNLPVGSIVNDCGQFDIWPVMAKSITWGFGSSGVFGFGHSRVLDRFHRFGHSGFLNAEFAERYWLPFLRDGSVVAGVAPGKRSWWLSLLTFMQLKFVLPALVLLAFVPWWQGSTDRPVRDASPDPQVETRTEAALPNATDTPHRVESAADRPIVFMADPDGLGHQDVYLIAYDGSGTIRALTLNALNDVAGRVYAAGWSPDGRHIAFVADHSGTQEVWVMDRKDLLPRRLSTMGQGKKYAQWAPDSRSLLVEWVEQELDDAARTTRRSVYQWFLDGSGSKKLIDPPRHIWNSVWSPTGDTILYSKRLSSIESSEHSESTLFLFDIETEKERPLLPNPNWEQAASWAPSGSRIAFSSNRDGVNYLIVYDLESKVETEIMRHNADDQAPIWSPDGTRLAVVRDERRATGAKTSNEDHTGYEIWTFLYDGADGIQITDNDVYDGWVRWSPDGNWLVFERAESTAFDARTQLWVSRADGSAQRQLTTDGGFRPSW